MEFFTRLVFLGLILLLSQPQLSLAVADFELSPGQAQQIAKSLELKLREADVPVFLIPDENMGSKKPKYGGFNEFVELDGDARHRFATGESWAALRFPYQDPIHMVFYDSVIRKEQDRIVFNSEVFDALYNEVMNYQILRRFGGPEIYGVGFSLATHRAGVLLEVKKGIPLDELPLDKDGQVLDSWDYDAVVADAYERLGNKIYKGGYFPADMTAKNVLSDFDPEEPIYKEIGVYPSNPVLHPIDVVLIPISGRGPLSSAQRELLNNTLECQQALGGGRVRFVKAIRERLKQ